jgi:hypothetical protein
MQLGMQPARRGCSAGLHNRTTIVAYICIHDHHGRRDSTSGDALRFLPFASGKINAEVHMVLSRLN